MARQHTTPSPENGKKIRFTKDAIESLPTPEKRQYVYDDKVIGLGITLMPSGTKTYHVRATVNGKTKRVTIGRFPNMKVEQARTVAKGKLSDMAVGVDPIEQKRAQRAAENVSGLTVEDAVEWFCREKHRKVKATGENVPLKESTKDNYRKHIAALIGDRYQKPIAELTEDVISRCVRTKEKTSKSVAAGGCRSLSSVWDWVSKRRDFRDQMPVNPVKEFARFNEGLHRPAPRQRRLDVMPDQGINEIKDWFDALDDCTPLIREYYLWMLFTGARAGEARDLEWTDINWKHKTYRLEDPKNRVPVDLPIPSYMLDLLKVRRKESGRVFASTDAVRYQRDKIAAKIGKKWSNHDLRRTFSGLAAGVCPYTSVKRLLNHSFTDITETYIGQSADLHAEIDKVQREVLRLAGRPVDNVVPMREVVG